MSRKSLGGLIVINVVLIAVLALLSFTPQTAEAQLGGGRRAGDYLMVAGTLPGRDSNAVYIIDLNNAAMMAVNYDNTQRTLTPLGSARDLTADFTPAGGKGAGGNR